MDLPTLLLVVVAVALGAVLGAALVGRRRPDAGPVVPPSVLPSEPQVVPAVPADPEPEPDPEHEPEPDPEPESEPEPVATPVPPVRLRPRPARDAPSASTSTSLGTLATPHDEDPGGAADDALVAAIEEVAGGGLLVVSGEGSAATSALAALLGARLDDRDVVRIAPPGRHDRVDASGGVVGTAVHEPLRTVIEGAELAGAAQDAVLVIEHSERHLRRGLDPSTLDVLRRAHPDRIVVLVVGATADAGAIDDLEQWLRGLVVPGSRPLGPDAADDDPVLDAALAELADRSPTGVDIVEAVAHAQAAGRLADVPTSVVLRLAAGLAGGDPGAPVPPAALAGVLDAVEAIADGSVLLRTGGTDRDGLPTTLATDARLVARCVTGVGELSGTLLAVLLDDADDVELLAVARVLAAADDPRPALAALDRLVAAGGPLAVEARLVRGVVGDRLGRSDALDDYLAVAADGDRDLALHARFLAGGLLEAEGDITAARDAYETVVASEHPVHAPMAAFNLAWLDEREGDTDAATAAYRTLAAGSHPDAGPMAALNLASLLQRMKRFPESESWFRVAVDSKHPDAAPMAAVALGLMLEQRQRPREARTLFRYAASTGHEEAAPAALRRLGAPRR